MFFLIDGQLNHPAGVNRTGSSSGFAPDTGSGGQRGQTHPGAKREVGGQNSGDFRHSPGKKDVPSSSGSGKNASGIPDVTTSGEVFTASSRARDGSSGVDSGRRDESGVTDY